MFNFLKAPNFQGIDWFAIQKSFTSTDSTMMRKLVLFTAPFLFFSSSLYAQLPPACGPGQLPEDNCGDACIYCDFNGYMGSTIGYTPDGGQGFCGSIENNQWLGFIAGAGSATFTATPTGCILGNGVQIALYTACNSDPIECNGGTMGGGNNPVSITSPLTPGVNYFLMIDGYGGDQCSFNITVSPPSAVQAPPIGNNIGAIQGPMVLCPGATVTYTVPPVTNAGGYTWTVPAGWLVNGDPGPLTVIAPGGNTVQITAGPNIGTNFQVCVQAANSCYPDGPSTCKSINVQNIPITNIPPVTICFEDAPYILPWGDQADVTGTYSVVMQSYLGCDSTVQQFVTVKSALFTNLPPKTICKNQCVTVCGEDFCDGGNFQTVCQSFQGCDSTITFSIQLLEPVAQINGGGVLTCTTTSILLTAEPSPPVTLFRWKNLAGQILGTNNSFLVTAAGTYILTSTMTGGALQCSESDTIVITSNTTPPTLTAAGGNLTCAQSSIQLSTTTNASSPTWSWTGPNGFNANIANPTVSAPGTYTVTVTSASNGCTATASTTVTGDTNPPSLATNGATLTCAITSAQITVNSTPAGSGFVWTGPNGFNSNIQTPTVTAAGTYTVTVTSSLNGCTSTANATVILNNTPPGATASTSGIITCPTPTVTLNGGPGTAGNTFSWDGPGFLSILQNPTAGMAGIYSLTVTGTNGCTSTATTSVSGDTVPPDAGAQGGTVSCGTPTITINGTSSVNSPGFSWTGPNGYSSNVQNPSNVTLPGIYTLTVTALNNCTMTATATVNGDFAAPDAAATGGVITCVQSSVTINGSSSTPGSTLLWNGPGGFISNQPSVTVNTLGDYTLTVTGPNGCTATALAQVTPDANLPNASAQGGTLNCAVNSIVLDGETTTPNAQLMWTGPNGFNSILEDPTVSVDGTYTLTVTNPVNGCTVQATVVVALDDVQPGANATGTTLTCTFPNLAINASSQTNGVNYNWTGPNGFNSSQQNPSVMDAGTYTVTVTNPANGCTSTAIATVVADQTAPVAVSTTGNLTCFITSLALNGSASLPSSYVWTGPNGFGSNLQNPTVTDPGDYTVTATAANGCTGTTSVTVTQDITPPGATATGNTIDCSNPSVGISSGTNTGLSFAWSGPNNFNSNQQNPTVNTDGIYTVTITGPNGCTSTASATVALDLATAILSAAAPDVLTCADTSINIQGTVSTSSSALQGLLWSGPNGFSSTLEDPAVTDPGTYTLTATTINGCTSTTTVTVDQDIALPDASAQGGTLNCAVTTIDLNGGSGTSNVAYSWTGPNNFVSNLEDPAVSLDGVYTLTVTGANGCIFTAQATVLLDVTLPDAATLSSNDLDCDDLSATLTASSQTSGVNYLWSGPNSFSASTAITNTTAPGIYQVAVTAPNGCVSTSTVTVLQDIVSPGATALGNTIDCNNPAVSISSGTNSGLSFAWTGPNNFNSNQQNPTVNTDGIYTVTITGANGCTSSANATVVLDLVTATLSATAPDVLTCSVDSVNIQGAVTVTSSALQGLLWSGPNNFSSTLEDPSVIAPGTYLLTATTINGCTATTTVNVNQDIALPNASAQGGTLNCAITTIDLDGGSSTSNVAFAWTGPNNFVSNLEDPAIVLDGVYTLTVTGANGCTFTAQATVLLDVTLPDAATLSSNNLDCDDLSTTLTASSQTTGVSYAWTGPNGFNANTAITSTIAPGDYQVAITAPNGCVSTSSVTVSQDIVNPSASATGATIDCISGQANLMGNSGTNNVNYAWTGPNNFNSNLQNPIASVEGQYVLTVTGANGCTATATATVLENTLSPEVTLTGGGTVTCVVPGVTIVGSISTSGASGVWTGPNNFSSTQDTITVSVPGVYTFTVTAQNGCISAPTNTVLINTQNPQGVTGSGGLLNCSFPSINLAGNSTTPGVTYLWTGPGNFMSNLPNPPVTNPGTYTLVVTDPVNGCTTGTTASVTQDPTVPSIAVTADSLTCTNPAVVLDATTNNPSVNFAWTGPNGFTSTLEDPSTSEPGAYQVVVTAISSGCSATFNYTVTENVNLPGVTAQGDTLTCTLTSGQLTSSSSAIGVLYAWTGPAGFTSNLPNPSVTLTGTYTVVTTGTNGCTSSAQVQVAPDVNAAIVTATGGTVTCAITSITLTANANIGVAWQWTGPGNFSSTQQNPTATVPGNYTVSATAPNGCVTPFGVTVLADTQSPGVTIDSPDELNCTTTEVGLNATVTGTGFFIYEWSTTNGNIVSGANSLAPTVSQAGVYTLLVTNTSNGCTTLQTEPVVSNDDTPNAADIQERDVACYGDTNGSASINGITGGTPPYLYSLDNHAFVPNTVFTSLDPGTHTLVVQDANGCEYATSFEILEPDELIVNLGPDTTIHLGTEISISLDNIVNFPDRVEETVLTPADLPIDSSYLPTYTLRYRVTVIDSNGCKATDDRLIIVDRTRWVYIPNVFDPNSSENNIVTVYGGPDVERIQSFLIFDRWGDAVHEVRDFDKNDLSKGWDGKARGQDVSPGVFVYYAEVLFKDGEVVLYKGDVTVVR